jgi:hypothetical protein
MDNISCCHSQFAFLGRLSLCYFVLICKIQISNGKVTLVLASSLPSKVQKYSTRYAFSATPFCKSRHDASSHDNHRLPFVLLFLPIEASGRNLVSSWHTTSPLLRSNTRTISPSQYHQTHYSYASAL